MPRKTLEAASAAGLALTLVAGCTATPSRAPETVPPLAVPSSVQGLAAKILKLYTQDQGKPGPLAWSTADKDGVTRKNARLPLRNGAVLQGTVVTDNSNTVTGVEVVELYSSNAPAPFELEAERATATNWTISAYYPSAHQGVVEADAFLSSDPGKPGSIYVHDSSTVSPMPGGTETGESAAATFGDKLIAQASGLLDLTSGSQVVIVQPPKLPTAIKTS